MKRLLFLSAIALPAIYYSYFWVEPLLIVFYVLALIVLVIPHYNVVKINFKQFSPLYVFISIIFLVLAFLFVNNSHFPNFLITDVIARLEKKSLFSPLARSFVFVSSIILMYQCKGAKKALGIITWITLFATSASSSRGALILAALVLYPMLPRHRFMRWLIMIVLGVSLISYSVFIIDLRGQSQVQLFNLGTNSGGYQPDVISALLFFLPSALRGEWVSTNVILSEMVMTQNQYAYIITFGDIANMIYGYGYFFPLILIYFGTLIWIMYLFVVKNIPKLKFYFLGLLCLIGGRVGLESLVPQLYIMFIPLAFFSFIALWRRVV